MGNYRIDADFEDQIPEAPIKSEPVAKPLKRPARTTIRRPAGTTNPEVPHLPKPPGFSCKPKAFFDYWRQTDPKFTGRIAVYFYRRWPVIDRDRPDKSKKRYIGIEVVPFPGDYESEILHRFGSGDYKLLLVDAGLSGKKICQTAVLGLREHDYPPVIEMDDLILEDPANKSYIEYLKREGALPSERESMANEAVTALTDTVRELSREVVEAGRKPAPPSPPNLDHQASVKGMEIISSAAQMGNKMLENALTKVAEVSQQRQDPLGMLDKVLDVADRLKPAVQPPPPKDDSTAIVVQALLARDQSLQDKLFQLQTARIESAEKLLMELRKPVEAAGQGQPRDIMSEIERLADIQTKIKKAFGIGGDDEGEGASKGGGKSLADHLPLIISGGLTIVGLIANAAHNAAVARTGQGQPAAPTAVEIPPELAQAAQAAALPVSGAAPASEEKIAMQPYHMMLRQIEQPLLNSLNAGEAGDEFADKLIGWFGRNAYDAIREIGKEALLTIIQTYPPIWGQVSNIPERFSGFLDEFLAYDRLVLEAQKREEEPPEEAPSRPSSRRKQKAAEPAA